ncbi:hypothetical protein B0H11DRAFT_2040922 [Mycena galericulata]|nr:hypothetical protein B0H11DRAFT_2040922 [Mycena galericulata]
MSPLSPGVAWTRFLLSLGIRGGLSGDSTGLRVGSSWLGSAFHHCMPRSTGGACQPPGSGGFNGGGHVQLYLIPF